jgi:hypothetical protein
MHYPLCAFLSLRPRKLNDFFDAVPSARKAPKAPAVGEMLKANNRSFQELVRFLNIFAKTMEDDGHAFTQHGGV